jgi:hypothetical protein
MAQKTLGTSLRIFTGIALPALAAVLCCGSVGCAVSSSGAVLSQAQQSENGAATGTVKAQFFGLVVKQVVTEPAVAMGSRRLWDSGVTWAALEPAAGSYNWTTLDAEVATAEAQGAQVMLTLGMTPAWASSQPGLGSSYGAGATAMPANLADWDAYVTAVATRYQGRIAAYEVWNAPETAAYWSGTQAQTGADMATLAVHAAADVHGADGAAVGVSPALSADGWAAFAAAGGGAAVDVVGTSLDGMNAGAAQAPEEMPATLAALRAAIAGTSADGKPVWNEQAAWVLPQSGLPQSGLPQSGVQSGATVDLQAAYVARALVLNAGFGVARMHWYAWDDTSVGVLALSNAQGQPTAAGAAYSTVEGWLNGAQMNGCSSSAAGVWTCQLVSSGATEWIVWAPGGAVASSSLGASTMTDLSGNVSAVSGDVTVGVSPVLLR